MTCGSNRVAYEPSLSPDGMQVAFAPHPLDVEGEGVITRCRVDGEGSCRSLTAPGDKTDASFSPDGERIVFSSDAGDLEFAELFVVPTAGGGSSK